MSTIADKERLTDISKTNRFTYINRTLTESTVLLELTRHIDLRISIGRTHLLRLIAQKGLLELTEWTSARRTSLLESTGRTILGI